MALVWFYCPLALVLFENTFGVSINVWSLAGDTLSINCNFLYCNHQVHRDFLITLYLLKTDERKV
jgi:hypothetical protein